MNTPPELLARKRIATAFGASAFAAYVVWNLTWWYRGQWAPSVFLWLTGLPCPTTGGTRSLASLIRGDVATSLSTHPFAVPLALLFGLSAYQAVTRGRLAAWMPSAWFWLLAFSWVSKI